MNTWALCNFIGPVWNRAKQKYSVARVAKVIHSIKQHCTCSWQNMLSLTIKKNIVNNIPRYIQITFQSKYKCFILVFCMTLMKLVGF